MLIQCNELVQSNAAHQMVPKRYLAAHDGERYEALCLFKSVRLERLKSDLEWKQMGIFFLCTLM